MLEDKLEQYYNLNERKKLIEKRLKVLSDQIKAEMEPDEPFHGSKVTAIVSFRRSKHNIDEGALEQLIVDKNLAAECMRLKVDHDLVEQLYIEGKITDNDLRAIDAGAKLTPVLVVERVVDGVQRQNDGRGERAGDRALHDRPHSEAT